MVLIINGYMEILEGSGFSCMARVCAEVVLISLTGILAGSYVVF